MIDKKLGYDTKTQELIERMCRYVERKDFVLDKKTAEEKIMQTYDLFGLSRPKKLVWVKDLSDKKFQEAARSARSAESVWFSGSARSVWSAWPARSARSAGSAWSAWAARSAGSACAAWAAQSTGSAWPARLTALDYDFDYFVFEHEYCLNPDSYRLPNEHDEKYLKYSELLLEGLEAGLGYRAEWEDTLYLCPTPIVKIDELNRFHSTTEPAIRWKGGEEFYFLHGVSFDKKWWIKVVKDKMSPETIFAIDNLEHRRIAYEYMDKTKMKKLKDYKILDEVKDDGKGNAMKVISFSVKGIKEPLKYLNCFCPTTGREYFIGTNFDTCWEAKAQSFGFKADEIQFINEW